MRIVVAIGGNALLERGEAPDAATQRRHLAAAAGALAGIARGNEVLLVHGNGPQVGMLALESEADHALTRPYPLSDLVAESQGLIGSWIQQELANAGGGPVCTLVTHVVVDPDDPAFAAPSKFIGGLYVEETARRLAADRGWTVRPDTGGWRRVVPSPRPLAVVELPVAETLLRQGVTVVLAGGGGIPVTDDAGRTEPVEAVVDKDYAAAVVAEGLHADLLAILTDVEGVMTDYGTPAEQLVRSAHPDDLVALAAPAGSMGPKIEAACAFVRAGGGRRAAIGALSQAEGVVNGDAGTQLTLSGKPEALPAVAGTNVPEQEVERPRCPAPGSRTVGA